MSTDAIAVPDTIELLPVDDHAVARAGIQHFIADMPDMHSSANGHMQKAVLATELRGAIHAILRGNNGLSECLGTCTE